MKPKFIFQTLILVVAVLFLSVSVSADDLTIGGTTSVTTVHGATATASLTISNTNTTENFKTVTLQSSNITFSTTSFGLNASQSKSITYSIAVPLYQAPGAYSYPFTVNGTKENGQNSSVSGTIQVNVNSSATLSVTQAPSTLTKSNNKTSFTVKNTGNVQLTSLIFSFNANNLKDDLRQITLTFSPNSILLINPGASETVNITATIPENLDPKDYTTTLVVNASSLVSTVSVSTPLTVSQSFCKFGNVGTGLVITKVEDEEVENEDAWEWKPLNDIEITVKVDNNLDEDVDAVLEYGLYDPDEKEFVDLDEEEIDFSIEEDEDEEVTIKFEVPADLDFDSSEHNFRFYVKVYEEGNEDKLCTDKIDGEIFKDVEIKKESRDVVVNDVSLPESALCGESLEYDATVFNTGRNEEDRVKIRLYNKELGVDLEKEIKNLDVGDDEEFSFSFTIPQNVAEKTYKLDATTFFDYDDDDNAYDETSDETFDSFLKVEGNCVKAVTKSARISASLETPEEDVVAGNEVRIKSTITNTGSDTVTYVVGVSRNEDFSSVESITPTSVTLKAGESRDVILTLMLDEDAEGDYTFTIKASFDNLSEERQVSLSVAPAEEERPGAGFPLTGRITESFQTNAFIWVIVAVNIILIIIIIIVAVRMSR